MITISTIVALCLRGSIRNTRFVPGDTSKAPIIVDENGKGFYQHPDGNVPISDSIWRTMELELEKCDSEEEWEEGVDYYTESEYDYYRMQQEQQSFQEPHS